MLELLARDLAEPLAGHAARDARRLRVALAHVDRVGAVRLREARADELLDLQHGRQVEALELVLHVRAHGGVEGLGGLLREDFARGGGGEAVRRLVGIWNKEVDVLDEVDVEQVLCGLLLAEDEHLVRFGDAHYTWRVSN